MGTFTRRVPVILLNAENVTTARQYAFGDWAYSDNNQHFITGTLTSGDSLAVQIITRSNQPYNTGELLATPITVTATASISPITTTDFCYSLDGPIQEILVQKTGTNGVATVIVM